MNILLPEIEQDMYNMQIQNEENDFHMQNLKLTDLPTKFSSPFPSFERQRSRELKSFLKLTQILVVKYTINQIIWLSIQCSFHSIMANLSAPLTGS